MVKKITSAWLNKHGACQSGSSWFASQFPDGAEIPDVLVKIVTDPAADDSWVPWLKSRSKYTELDWISKLPDSIGGSLDLSGCTIPDGLKLPDSIGGSLSLSGCTIPDGLKLPDSIGSLYLSGCTGISKESIPTNLKNKVIW